MSGATVGTRALSSASLLVPFACVACDVAARGGSIGAHPWIYALGAGASLVVWTLGMEAARHPRALVRRAALAAIGVTAAFGLGLQLVVHCFTHAYLGRRALLLAIGIPNITRSSYLARDALGILVACAVPALCVVGLAIARRRALGPRTRGAALAVAGFAMALAAMMVVPLPSDATQAMPPDALWMHGLGGPLLYLAGLADRPKVLPVGQHEGLAGTAAAASGPSIVLVVGESLRRDTICAVAGAGSTSRAAGDPGCSPSPRLDAAAPSRIGFARAFSPASCTDLASTVLWTGLSLTSSVEALARAPLLWDWAKARGYRTAYVTSQNLLFQQSDLFLRGSRIDLLREARDFAVDAPIDDGSPDEALTDVALSFLEREGPPAFVVIHHANTHAPYRQPADPGATPDDPWARYQRSVARNDALLGELVAKLRAGTRGRAAVLLYVSDHGEAFGEHGGYYHSYDLHAEQVDVPLWVDAPSGSVAEEAARRLRAEAATRPVTHADISATVVDLLGALDVPAYAEEVAALAGTSLLRSAPAHREVMLWDCPPIRECAAEAFGIMAYPLKLHWVGSAQRYECADLEVDPREASSTPLGRCEGLFPKLDAAFGARPRGGVGLASMRGGD